ncbi:MAG: alpha-galactosidase [Bacilli bacterium]|nr:alpha-galactosidase [Bacilli bacterium]
MITLHDGLIELSTISSTLLLSTLTLDKVTTEYYGPRLVGVEDYSPLLSSYGAPRGRAAILDKEKPNISLHDIPSDFSTPFLGDYHSPSLIMDSPKGGVFDFRVEKIEVIPHRKKAGYPTPHGEAEELLVLLSDKKMEAELELHYVVYEDSDVIGRYVIVHNLGEGDIEIDKVASMQLQLDDKGYELYSFHGNWAGEWNKEISKVKKTHVVFGSSTGSSCDYQQSFFILKQKEASYLHGEAMGFNLIYSGNHLEEVENNSYGEIRLLTGINPSYFRVKLAQNEEFETPEAIMAYSNNGLNGVANAMHRFVNTHVVPEQFAYKPRPVLYNNWEGTYFKFDEGKILSLAKKAKSLGVELFVLDDGWFGERNDDTSSLGDYEVNKKKLRHGLKGLSEKIHKMGMQFGLWFEPEAISENSDLYRAHPEYAIKDGVHAPVIGRNQLTLDLTNPEVREYVKKSLFETLDSAEIDYIKWDYNRTIASIDTKDGAYFHHYILGLYEILEAVREKYPNLLMENCASGGARNDLGMFSYFCQGWVSDDTDCYQRSFIQSNMGLGYPPSVMDNHVSGKTSHQLLRKTSLDTKFDVACVGVLGYELNLNDLDPIDEKAIKSQIEFYKAHRETLQFGRWYLLEQYEDNRLIVEMLGKEDAIISYVLGVQTPCVKQEHLPVIGLKDEETYAYGVREVGLDPKKFGSLVNMVLPIHVKEEGKLVNIVSRRINMPGEKFSGKANGSLLNSGGLRLPLLWGGTGLGEEVRVLGDFGARTYFFTREEKGE